MKTQKQLATRGYLVDMVKRVEDGLIDTFKKENVQSAYSDDRGNHIIIKFQGVLFRVTVARANDQGIF